MSQEEASVAVLGQAQLAFGWELQGERAVDPQLRQRRRVLVLTQACQVGLAEGGAALGRRLRR